MWLLSDKLESNFKIINLNQTVYKFVIIIAICIFTFIKKQWDNCENAPGKRGLAVKKSFLCHKHSHTAIIGTK